MWSGKQLWKAFRKSKWFIFLVMVGWFVLRVGPRPSRVLYPCQIGIMTSALMGFNVFFIGTAAAVTAFWRRLIRSKVFWLGCVFVLCSIIGLVVGAYGGVRL